MSHAPPVCDGAALALLGGEDMGPAPRARILGFAESGGDPEASLTAGFAAMNKVLDRASLTLADFDRIEFMESFAVLLDCLDQCDGTLGLVVVTGAPGVGAAMIVERLI